MAHCTTTQGKLSVFCIRLGWVLPRHSRLLYDGTRHLEIVIPPIDLARLLIAAIEAGSYLRFGIYHDLSANQKRRLNLSDTMQILNYVPVDDAVALAKHGGY